MKITELREKKEAKAKMMAFLTDASTIFDEGKNEYIILPRDEINEKYREAMNKGDIVLAKNILDGAQGAGLNIEKESREIISKSIRVDGVKYLQLLSEALKDDKAISDTVRLRICDFLQTKLSEAPEGIKKEKLNAIKKLLDNWKKGKNTQPKSGYSKSRGYYNYPDKESLINVHKAKLRLRLENENYLVNKKIPQDIIELILKDLEYDMVGFEKNGWVIDKSGKSSHIFEIHPTFYIIPGCDTEIIRKMATEIGGYELAQKVDELFDAEGGGDFDYTILPELASFDLRLFVNLKENQIFIDGIPLLEESKDKIKTLIMNKILLDKFKDFNLEKAKKQAIALVDKDIQKARSLTEDINLYKSFEKLSEWMANELFADMNSSEVVTFSAPKPIIYMFELLGGKV